MLIAHRCSLVLSATLALGFASTSHAATPDSSKVNTSITQVHSGAPGGASMTPPKEFHPIPLPDSVGVDIQTSWRLRSRVGKAFWPAWVTHSPAPLVVRGSPYDYFVLHPDPPSTTTAPREIPGGGYYYVSLQRLGGGTEPDMRIEECNRWWCVSYSAEGQRTPGSRPGTSALIATRDFMVYETMAWKPQWGGFPQMQRILTLRTSPDLVAWLDTEAVALRGAILTDDPKVRSALAHKAIRARGMAEDISAKDLKLKDALDWYEAAWRSEGAARYMSVLLENESRSVVAGDTSYALPEPGRTSPSGPGPGASTWRRARRET